MINLIPRAMNYQKCATLLCAPRKALCTLTKLHRPLLSPPSTLRRPSRPDPIPDLPPPLFSHPQVSGGERGGRGWDAPADRPSQGSSRQQRPESPAPSVSTRPGWARAWGSTQYAGITRRLWVVTARCAGRSARWIVSFRHYREDQIV